MNIWHVLFYAIIVFSAQIKGLHNSQALTLSFPHFIAYPYIKHAPPKFFYDAVYDFKSLVGECPNGQLQLPELIQRYETKLCLAWKKPFFSLLNYMDVEYWKCSRLLKVLFVHSKLLESYVAINNVLAKIPLRTFRDRLFKAGYEGSFLDHVWNMRRLSLYLEHLPESGDTLETKDALIVAYLLPKMFSKYKDILEVSPDRSNKRATYIHMHQIFTETLEERLKILNTVLQRTFSTSTGNSEASGKPKTVKVTLDLLMLLKTFPDIVGMHFSSSQIQPEHQIDLLYEAIGNERFRTPIFSKVRNVKISESHQIIFYYTLFCLYKLHEKFRDTQGGNDVSIEQQYPMIQELTFPELIATHLQILELIKKVSTDAFQTYKEYIEALKVCSTVTESYIYLS